MLVILLLLQCDVTTYVQLYFCVMYHVELLCVLFFFFKQKTAYEVRISDWSSDVCSSDLGREAAARRGCGQGGTPGRQAEGEGHRHPRSGRRGARLPAGSAFADAELEPPDRRHRSPHRGRPSQ